MYNFIKYMRNKGLLKTAPKDMNISELKASEADQKKVVIVRKAKKKKQTKKVKQIDISKIFGIDCEMVGVGEGEELKDVLARVSIVTRDDTLLDTFVRVEEPVIEYRTDVSGVRKEDLEGDQARDFHSVVEDVRDILARAEIIVGHGLGHDEEVLEMEFESRKVRDTSTYRPFFYNGRTPSLKKLAMKNLKTRIQDGQHNPVEDARTALLLYLQVNLIYFLLFTEEICRLAGEG